MNEVCDESDLGPQRQYRVLRLSSIPQDVFTSIGVDPANIETVATLLSQAGIALNVQEVLDVRFREQTDQKTPFPVSRFSDGSWGVYYAAIELETCCREIQFHLVDEMEQVPEVRFYSLIACEYAGKTTDLLNMEVRHPKLVSESRTGYPFCQRIARLAIKHGRDGLRTRSARNPMGTCIPVFARSALSSPEAVQRFRVAVVAPGKLSFEPL